MKADPAASSPAPTTPEDCELTTPAIGSAPAVPPRPASYPHDVAFFDHPGDTGLFGRHFVSMIVAGKAADGVLRTASFSAFVAVSGNVWNLMTAGHSIAKLRQQVAAGFQISTWELNDAHAEGPFRRTVAAGVGPDDWTVLYSEDEPSGIDIAAVALHAFTTRALAANGVVPLDLGADYARLAARPFDRLALAGITSESSVLQGARLEQKFYIIPVLRQALADVSAMLQKGPDGRMFGVIHGEGWATSGITDINGTSGGPVFGLWLSADGRSFDYAAVGIQSGWDPTTRQIAAWSLGSLSGALADAMQEGTG